MPKRIMLYQKSRIGSGVIAQLVGCLPYTWPIRIRSLTSHMIPWACQEWLLSAEPEVTPDSQRQSNNNKDRIILAWCHLGCHLQWCFFFFSLMFSRADIWEPQVSQSWHSMFLKHFRWLPQNKTRTSSPKKIVFYQLLMLYHRVLKCGLHSRDVMRQFSSQNLLSLEFRVGLWNMWIFIVHLLIPTQGRGVERAASDILDLFWGPVKRYV